MTPVHCCQNILQGIRIKYPVTEKYAHDGGDRATIEHPATAGRLSELLHKGELDVFLEIRADIINLFDDIWMVDRLLRETGNDLARILPTSLFAEPSWRLLLGDHRDDEKNTGDMLESKGNTPDALVVEIRITNLNEHAIIDPEGEGDADDDEELVHSRQTTTNVLWRRFGNIGGDDDGDEADTKSTNRTTDVELNECGFSRLASGFCGGLEKRAEMEPAQFGRQR